MHQKLNFIGSINRDYDPSFAQEGAKIGDSLKIRLPNQYTVTTGKTLVAQDTTESSVTLQVSTQKHVGMNFSTAELALSIDDFTKRIINPAMSVLAANIESDALSMYQQVYNQVSDVGNGLDYADVLSGRKILQDNLAPSDERTALLDTQMHVDVIDDVKALFNQQAEIGKQFKEGFIGRTGGFDFMENTMMPFHTTGTENGASITITTGSSSTQTGATITVVNGSSKTLEKGDIITLPGVYRVHPETKVSTGVLQQFVVTADLTAGATSLSISPAIVTSGATQNVSASPTATTAITKVGGASADHGVSLLYAKDAFTFATADLVMPKGVDFARREVFDGISLRLVRQYDINNDNLPCRVDVIYGYKAIRPEWAVRLAFN